MDNEEDEYMSQSQPEVEEEERNEKKREEKRKGNVRDEVQGREEKRK